VAFRHTCSHDGTLASRPGGVSQFVLSAVCGFAIQDCVEWWILAFSEMDEREVSYLTFLLRKKQLFQQGLRAYLRARAELRAAQSSAKSREAPSAAGLAKLQSDCATSCRNLANHFPDPAQALDSMQTVSEQVELPPDSWWYPNRWGTRLGVWSRQTPSRGGSRAQMLRSHCFPFGAHPDGETLADLVGVEGSNAR
jgi:hypothetical protein